MSKNIDKRIVILFAALILLAAIVGIVLVTGSSDKQKRSAGQEPVAKVSAPLNLSQMKAQARKHSLTRLFVWASPDQKIQARASLERSPKQLRVGYLDPVFKTASEKSRQKSTVFIVSEVPASNLDISRLQQTASKVVKIKGAEVYIPPKALIKQGQLFVLSNDHKLAGLVSSIFTTQPQLQRLAQQILMINS